MVNGASTKTRPVMPDRSTVQILSDGPPLADSDAMGRRVLEQAFDLWINPELARRKASGVLPEDFALWGAQRIQPPEGAVTIRINDEIRGVASIKARRAVEKGDGIVLGDLEGLEDFDLPSDELDNGHWTVLWTGERWFTSFNFMTQRNRCLLLLDKADHFLAASRRAEAEGHAAVSVDTLFSACELASKAHLVSSHTLPMGTKTHGPIHSGLNIGRRLGNIESAFVDIFNKMNRLRGPYRYDDQQSESMPIGVEDFDIVETVIATERERLRSRLSDDIAGSENGLPDAQPNLAGGA